jgi:rod shape-determining protein MreD
MKFFLTVVLALALLTVESVVVRYLGFSIVRIDVTVAIVAFLALRAGTLEGAVSAYGVGYLLDLTSGQPTGLYTFLAVFTFLLGRLAASLVDVRSRVAFALFALGADVGHSLLAIFFSWLTSKAGGYGASAFAAIPVQALLTALAALLLYPLLHRIDSGEDRAHAGYLR